MAEEAPVELRVQVEANGANDEEFDRLPRDLLAELRDLPVESAEIRVAATLSAGAKSFGIEALGALAIKVAPALYAHSNSISQPTHSGQKYSKKC